MPEQCSAHEFIVKEINQYHSNQQEIVKGQHELRERVKGVEESSKSAHHRLDDLQELTKGVADLAYQVKRATEQTEMVLKELGLHRKEIDDLKERPNKTMWIYLEHAFKYLIGAGLAYIILEVAK